MLKVKKKDDEGKCRQLLYLSFILFCPGVSEISKHFQKTAIQKVTRLSILIISFF